MSLLFSMFCALLGAVVFAQDQPSPSETLRHRPPDVEQMSDERVPADSSDNSPRRMELEDLVIADDVESGLIVVIVDPFERLRGNPPSGRFGRGEDWTPLDFRDDGTGPDGAASDGQYVAWAPLSVRGGMTEIRLYGPGETPLYVDSRIPLPWEREHPTIAVLIMEDGDTIPTIETNDIGLVLAEEMGAAGSRRSGDEGVSASSSASASGTGDGSSEPNAERAPMNSSDDGSKPWRWFGLFLLVGLVSVGTAKIRTRAKLRLVPIGTAASVPISIRDDASVWVLPNEENRLEALVHLARTRAASGPVLICARTEYREMFRSSLSGEGTIHWCPDGRATIEEIARWCSKHDEWGRGLIIVEGPNALDDSPKGRDWRTFASRPPANWDVRVLLVPSEGSSDPGDRVVESGEFSRWMNAEASDV